MSEAGKNQEPSMEEILASIRRIIAEDEAGRARSGPAPLPPRAVDGPSRTPRPRNGIDAPAPRAPQGGQGEMVQVVGDPGQVQAFVIVGGPCLPP